MNTQTCTIVVTATQRNLNQFSRTIEVVDGALVVAAGTAREDYVRHLAAEFDIRNGSFNFQVAGESIGFYLIDTTGQVADLGGSLVLTGKPLGSVQRSVYASLVRNGPWHATCGWLWSSRSTTLRIMRSLAARGLADRSVGANGEERFTAIKCACDLRGTDGHHTARCPLRGAA